MTAQSETSLSHSAEGRRLAPLLSVTILNYNYAHFLPQCLDSILRQTFTDFELILINDCSTDNSLEVIHPYLADPRVKLVNHEQNKGYIASLIEGSEMSVGKYIMVISADDYCVSNRAFEELLALMESDQETAFGYSAYGNYSHNGALLGVIQQHADSYVRTGAEEYPELVYFNHVLHSGLIIRKSAYDAVGGYNATARYACDTIMWLVLCGQGKVAYCHHELFAYRHHGSNMSVSRDGIRGTVQELAYGVRKSYAIMRGSPGVTPRLYIVAMKRILCYRTMESASAGRLGEAWYAYWCAFRVDPVLTVFQSKTLGLIGRTLLGPRGYRVGRALLHRDWASLVTPA